MGTFKKNILILSLLLATSALAQTALDDHYNQGRVLGGEMLRSQIAADFYSEGSAQIVAPSLFRFGTDNISQYNILGIPYLGFSLHDLNFAASILGINATHRFAPGHRLSWFAYQDLSWISLSDNRFYTGPTDGNLTHLPIGASYDFLSQKGSIQQKESDYNISFYRGPLLNQGQFQLKGALQFDVKEKGYPKYVSFTPSVGISDNLELSTRFESNKSWRTDTILKQGLLDQTLSATLVFRLPQFHLQIIDNFRHEKNTDSTSLFIPPSITEISDHNLSIYAFLLLGKRNLTINNVAGNWDNTYNSQLGKQQFSLETYFNTFFYNEIDPETKDTILTVTPYYFLRLGYGLTDRLTFKLNYDKYPTPYQDQFTRWIGPGFFRIGLDAGNKPLRTKGPHEVSRMEYEFGTILEKKQYRISASAIIPKLGNPIYSYFYMNDEPYLQDYYTSLNNLNNIPSNNFGFKSSQALYSNADFSIQANYGLGYHMQSGLSVDYFYSELLTDQEYINTFEGYPIQNVLTMSPYIRYANESTAMQFSTIIAFYPSKVINLFGEDEPATKFYTLLFQLVHFF